MTNVGMKQGPRDGAEPAAPIKRPRVDPRLLEDYANQTSSNTTKKDGQKARGDEASAVFIPTKADYKPSEEKIRKSDGQPFTTTAEYTLTGVLGGVESQRFARGVSRSENGSLVLDVYWPDKVDRSLPLEKMREVRDFCEGKFRVPQSDRLRRPFLGAMYTAGGVHSRVFPTNKSQLVDGKFKPVLSAEGRTIPVANTVLDTRDFDPGAVHLNHPDALRTLMASKIAFRPFAFSDEMRQGHYASDFTFALPFGSKASELMQHSLAARGEDKLTRISVVYGLGRNPHKLFFWGDAHPAKEFNIKPSDQWKWKEPGQQAEVPHFFCVERRASEDVDWESDEVTSETYAIRFLLRGEVASVLMGGAAPYSWRYIAPVLFDPEHGITGVGIAQLYVTGSSQMAENRLPAPKDGDEAQQDTTVKFGALHDVIEEACAMDSVFDKIIDAGGAPTNAMSMGKAKMAQAAEEQPQEEENEDAMEAEPAHSVSARDVGIVGGAHFAFKSAYADIYSFIRKFGFPVSANVPKFINLASRSMMRESHLAPDAFVNKTYGEYSATEMRGFQWLNSPCKATTALRDDPKNTMNMSYYVLGPKTLEWYFAEPKEGEKSNAEKLAEWQAAELAARDEQAKNPAAVPKGDALPAEEFLSELTDDRLLPSEALEAAKKKAAEKGPAQKQRQEAYGEYLNFAMFEQLNCFAVCRDFKPPSETEKKVMLNFCAGIPGCSASAAEAAADEEAKQRAVEYLKHAAERRAAAAAEAATATKPLSDAEMLNAAMAAEAAAMKNAANATGGEPAPPKETQEETQHAVPAVAVPGLDGAPTIGQAHAPSPPPASYSEGPPSEQ